MFHGEVGSGGSLDNGRDNRLIGMWERVEENHGFEIIWQGKTSSRYFFENVNGVVDLIRKIFHVTTTMFTRINNVVFEALEKLSNCPVTLVGA